MSPVARPLLWRTTSLVTPPLPLLVFAVRHSSTGESTATAHGMWQRLIHVDDSAIFSHLCGDPRNVARIVDARVQPTLGLHSLKLEHLCNLARPHRIEVGKQLFQVAPLFKVRGLGEFLAAALAVEEEAKVPNAIRLR